MSEKYTYADVIIDPEDPRVEIGKEYWFADHPFNVLSFANRGDGACYGILSEIDREDITPFFIRGQHNACIIRKKIEYTEADIISDLNDPRLKDAIGKVCYVAPRLYGYDIVINANNDDTTHKGVLVNLGYDPSHPFEVHTEMGLHWKDIIIAKKQPEKHYVPFNLSREEDRAKLRGAWIRRKDYPGDEYQIVGISITNNLIFFDDSAQLVADVFLERCEFVDGSPCGKLVEEE